MAWGIKLTRGTSSLRKRIVQAENPPEVHREDFRVVFLSTLYVLSTKSRTSHMPGTHC